MKYDFTTIIDRHGKDAIAIDGLGRKPGRPMLPDEGFDVIPMWVADMNFPTVPTIQESIIKRATRHLVILHQRRNIINALFTGRKAVMV